MLYYGVLNALWLISPALAYNFSELIEAHAVDTYAQFAEQNKEALRELPAPRIARRYYEEGDLYLFDEFQTARPRSSRRVQVRRCTTRSARYGTTRRSTWRRWRSVRWRTP